MSKVETLVQDALKLNEQERIQLLGEVLARENALLLSKALGALETKFGVKAAAPVGPTTTTEKKDQKTEGPTTFTVILKDAGPNKINVIKAVREVTALGLKEAKDLVDKGGQPVKAGIEKADAEKLAKTLEAAGAKVEIKGQ